MYYVLVREGKEESGDLDRFIKNIREDETFKIGEARRFTSEREKL